MLKILVQLLIIGITMLCFTGCNEPIEDMITADFEVIEPANGNITSHEYPIRLSQVITGVVSDGTMILGRIIDVKNGLADTTREMEIVESAIDNVEEGLSELELMNEPLDEEEKKADTINAIEDYKQALIDYYELLSSGSYSEKSLSDCADKIESAMALVKMGM